LIARAWQLFQAAGVKDFYRSSRSCGNLLLWLRRIQQVNFVTPVTLH
jgi:hypothetical protein